MKIIDIYQKFGIPPNLGEHMLRVCSIVEYLEQHWKSDTKVDWKETKKIALLHDLGNIVKFDFDKHPEFLGDEQKNVDHWRKKQAETIKKYGNDDHKATEAMLSELEIDDSSIKLILNKSFGNSIETVQSNNWILKILYYADLRTLPFGIGSLTDRINDVRERMPKYTNRPDFEDLVNACQKIEEQLQQNLNISVNEINDKNVKIDASFLELEI